MRHEPALVDGIAREAAAEMIVDAAERHALQGQEEALLRLRRRCGGRTRERNSRIGGLRKFRGALQAAVLRVDERGEPRTAPVEVVEAERAAVARAALREALLDRVPVLEDRSGSAR